MRLDSASYPVDVSKKKKRPEPPASRAELIEARVLREREWCFAAWMARMSWQTMRAAAAEPPERGGLGTVFSVSALRALVKEAREDRGDVNMSRDERIERQSFEIDERIRLARHDLAAAVDLGDPKLVESAEKRLQVAMRDERDLFGLDAAKRLEAEVTTRDGVIEDLNAALAAIGEAPEKVKP